MGWPLKFTITGQGPGHWEKDRFNNDVWVPGEPIQVAVFSWEVTKSEELDSETSVLRTVDDLVIIAPADSFTPQTAVKLPNGDTWEIQGNPEDVNNNPYYSPGLVTYHARKVEG